MATELPPDRQTTPSRPDRIVEVPDSDRRENSEIVSWPTSQQERLDWKNILGTTQQSERSTYDLFPGAIDYRNLKGPIPGGRNPQMDFRPGVSNDEIKGMRDQLLKAGVVEYQSKSQHELPTKLPEFAHTDTPEHHATKNNDGGGVVDIKYPGGKQSRTLSFDCEGKLVRFSEQDEDGKRSFVKDASGQWHLKAGLRNIPVPGNFEVTKDGDFVSTENNTSAIQSLDGSIHQEQINKDGTRVRMDDAGNITRLTRKDGSSVDITWTNGEKKQITETEKDGTKTTWNRTDAGWQTGNNPEAQRKNIEITKEGMLAAENMQGRKHVTRGDGTKVTEGEGGAQFNLDEQGRITSIKYAKGSEWGRLNFKYDESGKLSQWEMYNAQDKLIQTRVRSGDDKWQVTEANGKNGGVWTGDVQVSPEGNLMQRDAKDKANGIWSHVTPECKTYQERTTDTGMTRTFTDKTEISFATDGKVSGYKTAGVSRAFTYENGQISTITDTTSAGTKTFNAKEHKNVGVDPKTGDYFYETDGNVTVSKLNGSKVQINADGLVTDVTTANGANRHFSYKPGTTDLESIVDKRTFGDKVREDKWDCKKNEDGTYKLSRTGTDGKEIVRNGAEVGLDGSFKYKGADGKEIVSRLDRLGDGSVPASVEEAREYFTDAMREHLDEAHMKRLEEMTKGFEERMNDRAEARKLAGLVPQDKLDQWQEQSMAMTYKNLADMVSSNNPNTFYDQKTRAKLAENFMFHAQDPTTMDQGMRNGDSDPHGTCWIQSGHIWGMVQHPDKMARLLSQVSLEGKFTTLNSGEGNPAAQTYGFNPDYLKINQDSQESRWSIDGAFGKLSENRRQWINNEGDRSPVGKIFDCTLSILGGRREGDVESGYYQNTHRGFGARNIMHMVTGDVPCDLAARRHSEGHLINNDYRLSLLEKGTVINYRPNHMLSLHLRKQNGEWQQIQDNQHGESGDEVLSRIQDLKGWMRGDRSSESQGGGVFQRRRLALGVPEHQIGAISAIQTGAINFQNQPRVCRPGQKCGPVGPERIVIEGQPQVCRPVQPCGPQVRERVQYQTQPQQCRPGQPCGPRVTEQVVVQEQVQTQPRVCLPGQPCGPEVQTTTRPEQQQFRQTSPFVQQGCPDQQPCRVRCNVPRRRLFRRCG